MGTVVALRAPDDVLLARRCVDGDRSAQRELFQRHRHHVHATLFRILGSNREMEDLVQEAFLEIFRSLKGFRGEATLSTWLDRISVRVAYAHIGRRQKEGTHLELLPDVPANDASAEDRAMARQVAQRLYDVLEHVEVRQRVAFTLHVIDGRSVQDVAAVMDASVVVTKTRVWRAWRAVNKRARHDPLLAGLVRHERARTEGGVR